MDRAPVGTPAHTRQSIPAAPTGAWRSWRSAPEAGPARSQDSAPACAVRGLVVRPDPKRRSGNSRFRAGMGVLASERHGRGNNSRFHQAGDLVPLFPDILFQTRNIERINCCPLIQGLPFRRHLPRLPLSINKLDIELFFEFLQAHTNGGCEMCRASAALLICPFRQSRKNTLAVSNPCPPRFRAAPCRTASIPYTVHIYSTQITNDFITRHAEPPLPICISKVCNAD